MSDHSGQQWVTIFNDTAEAILGKKSDEIGLAFEKDKIAYNAMFKDITFKTFVFKIRTKLENFGVGCYLLQWN